MPGKSENALPGPGGATAAWSVSALLLAVNDALAARWPVVAVQGEVSAATRAASGHWYFSLKDSDGAQALIRCAMFRRAASLATVEPRSGLKVLVRGRLAVYEGRGDLQLIVESLQAAGEGALYEQFVRLRARLQAEGLFDADRKRALPRWPVAIGVLTSAAGAAVHDVMTALRRRSPHVRVVLYPCVVQGPEAPRGIVDALARANARNEVDVLLLCRGGGSLEDLWSFNDERVVRAVAQSALPVICGVGHESDSTLSDFAADLRAPTPTAAAELSAPDREAVLEALQGLQHMMSARVGRRLDAAQQRVDLLGQRLQAPAAQIAAQRLRLQHLSDRSRSGLVRMREQAVRAGDNLAARLLQSTRRELERRSHALERLATRLGAVDPKQVLTRGYVWIADADGAPVISASGVVPGDRVTARWADGEADLEARSVRPGG